VDLFYNLNPWTDDGGMTKWCSTPELNPRTSDSKPSVMSTKPLNRLLTRQANLHVYPEAFCDLFITLR